MPQDEAPQPEPQPQPEQQPSGGDSTMQRNSEVRQLIMQIGRLAQQVPEAQAEFQAAAKALTAASLKIISSQQPQPTGQQAIGA